MAVYDDQNPKDSHEYSLTGDNPQDGLANKEKAGQNRDKTGDDEKRGLFKNKDNSSDLLGGGAFNPTDKFMSPQARLGKYLGQKFTKKNSAIGGAVGAIIGISIFAFGIAQGPLQFVHFSQLLQKFHLRGNEDFNDSRASRLLYHGVVTGKIQNSRLGIVGNFAADKWEKRVFKKTGMRPVYTSTGRFIGYELVDEDKALNSLLDTNNIDDKTSKRLEDMLGKGAKIHTAAETPNNVRPVDPGGNPLDGKAKFLDLSRLGFKERRQAIKIMGKVTGSNGIVSGQGSRLLLKRGGVKYHVMEKYKDKYDKNRDNRKTIKELKKEEREARESYIQRGVKALKGAVAEKTKDDDGDGQPDSVDPGDEETSKSVSDALKDFKNSGALKTAKGPAIVIGISCGVVAYGNSIEEYRMDNTFGPAERIGMMVVSTGDQVKNMTDFDMDNLSVQAEYLRDEGDKTTGRPASNWSGSESILAEQGKTGGVPMPKEADLRGKGGKPKLFDLLDGIPGLGTTCGAIDAATGVWGVRHILGAVNSVTEGAINVALNQAGTSTDELMESSFKLLSGKSIDPASKGANFGSIANLGTFLSANDQAISTGGVPLTTHQAYELRKDREIYDKKDYQNQSFASRYLDMYNSESMLGSIMYQLPNSNSMASFINNPGEIFSSGITSFLPKNAVSAAGTYDYGVPRYGYSIEDQEDPEFEDPYKNAEIVEPQLDALNSKYGKCFNMTITVDDSGPHIESGKTVDPYKIAKEPECNQSTAKSNNGDENKKESFLTKINPFSSKKAYAQTATTTTEASMFKRYRFYIADTVNSLSLACYEADDSNPDDTVGTEACKQLGIGSGAGTPQNTAGGGDLAQNKDKFTDILKLPSGAVGPPEIAFYHQCQDERWANKPYEYNSGGSNTICASACGPSSLAMVISTLGNKIINPYEMAQKSKDYHVSGGTDMNQAIKLVEDYGLKQRKINGTKAVRDTLKNGGFVIMSANPSSPFTQAGHFIVIRGVSEDGSKFYVADPADDNGNGKNRNSKEWPMSSLNSWVSTGLWAVEK